MPCHGVRILVSIGSGNGLLQAPRHILQWNFSWNSITLAIIQEKALEIVFCKVSAFVSGFNGGRVTLCVSKLTIIVPDNGLSPGGRQAIIWTNDGMLLIWPLGTNFSEISIEVHIFSFKKMQLKISSAKCRRFRLRLNALSLKGLLADPALRTIHHHAWRGLGIHIQVAWC